MTWWLWTVISVYLLLGIITKVEGVPFLVWLLCKLFWPVFWLYVWHAYREGKGTLTLTIRNKKRVYHK